MLKYTSTEDGQVIESATPIDYLEGLARWVRTGDVEASEATPEGLVTVLIVSSPSGTPEESISGGPFPGGYVDPIYSVNVPSPDTFTGAEAVGVQVEAPKPDPNFDAGNGRHSDPVDLLGTPPSKIVDQANDLQPIVTLSDLAESLGQPELDVPVISGESTPIDRENVTPPAPAPVAGATDGTGDGQPGVPESAPDHTDGRPNGNATTELWFAYATETRKLDIPADAKRNAIIEAVEAADKAAADAADGTEAGE
jgi:hypothetical protein